MLPFLQDLVLNKLTWRHGEPLVAEACARNVRMAYLEEAVLQGVLPLSEALPHVLTVLRAAAETDGQSNVHTLTFESARHLSTCLAYKGQYAAALAILELIPCDVVSIFAREALAISQLARGDCEGCVGTLVSARSWAHVAALVRYAAPRLAAHGRPDLAARLRQFMAERQAGEDPDAADAWLDTLQAADGNAEGLLSSYIPGPAPQPQELEPGSEVDPYARPAAVAAVLEALALGRARQAMELMLTPGSELSTPAVHSLVYFQLLPSLGVHDLSCCPLAQQKVPGLVADFWDAWGAASAQLQLLQQEQQQQGGAAAAASAGASAGVQRGKAETILSVLACLLLAGGHVDEAMALCMPGGSAAAGAPEEPGTLHSHSQGGPATGTPSDLPRPYDPLRAELGLGGPAPAAAPLHGAPPLQHGAQQPTRPVDGAAIGAAGANVAGPVQHGEAQAQGHTQLPCAGGPSGSGSDATASVAAAALDASLGRCEEAAGGGCGNAADGGEDMDVDDDSGSAGTGRAPGDAPGETGSGDDGDSEADADAGGRPGAWGVVEHASSLLGLPPDIWASSGDGVDGALVLEMSQVLAGPSPICYPAYQLQPQAAPLLKRLLDALTSGLHRSRLPSAQRGREVVALMCGEARAAAFMFATSTYAELRGLAVPLLRMPLRMRKFLGDGSGAEDGEAEAAGGPGPGVVATACMLCANNQYDAAMQLVRLDVAHEGEAVAQVVEVLLEAQELAYAPTRANGGGARDRSNAAPRPAAAGGGGHSGPSASAAAAWCTALSATNFLTGTPRAGFCWGAADAAERAHSMVLHRLLLLQAQPELAGTDNEPTLLAVAADVLQRYLTIATVEEVPVWSTQVRSFMMDLLGSWQAVNDEALAVVAARRLLRVLWVVSCLSKQLHRLAYLLGEVLCLAPDWLLRGGVLRAEDPWVALPGTQGGVHGGAVAMWAAMSNGYLGMRAAADADAEDVAEAAELEASGAMAGGLQVRKAVMLLSVAPPRAWAGVQGADAAGDGTDAEEGEGEGADGEARGARRAARCVSGLLRRAFQDTKALLLHLAEQQAAGSVAAVAAAQQDEALHVVAALTSSLASMVWDARTAHAPHTAAMASAMMRAAEGELASCALVACLQQALEMAQGHRAQGQGQGLEQQGAVAGGRLPEAGTP